MKSVRNPLRLCLIAQAIAMASFSASAQEASSTLEPILVTATRGETAQDETLASTTVLTREDIARSQVADVLELLQHQTGLDLARTGGPGSATTLFTRGGNSNHTLILIDGVRVNSATQGLFDLSQLPASAIERIEIVRGPRAAIWGSDALGGVVQIFTRSGQGGFAEATLGSDARWGIAGGLRSGGETYFGINAGLSGSEGFSATNPANFAHDPDDDGFDQRFVNLQAGTRIGDQRLSAQAYAVDLDSEFDQGLSEGQQRVLGASLAGPLAGRWGHVLSLGYSEDQLITAAFGSDFGGDRISADWMLHFAGERGGDLRVGISHARESAYSLNFGAPDFDTDRDNSALFLNWLFERGSHRFDLALRHDDNSQYGGHTTSHAAWGWSANEALQLRASLGQGFRAPNFNELYYPGFFGFFAGNPELNPETSLNRELGLEWRIAEGHALGLSVYRNDVRELIGFTGVNFRAENTGRARIEGAELQHRWSGVALSVNSALTWQDARNADTDAALLRRAPRKASLVADWRLNATWNIGLDLLALSRRPDFSTELPGFARWDVRLAAKLSPQWELGLRLENLGDRFYELVDGYNTQGRGASLNLRWTGH